MESIFKEKSSPKNILLLDIGNFIHRNLSVAAKNIGSTEWDDIKGMFLHMFLNSILSSQKDLGEYGESEVIACWDVPTFEGYWRKDLLPEYKGSREEDRKKRKIDYKKLYELLNQTVLPAFQNIFPYKNITTPRSEADDSIGVLAKELSKNKHIERITIVSVDKDLSQLLTYEKVYQYNPVKQEFIPNNNRIKNGMFLEKHICLGDAIDGILSIFKHSVFHDSFIKYLKNKLIETTLDDVFVLLDGTHVSKVEFQSVYFIRNIQKVVNFNELVENFDIVDKWGDKTIYKELWMGEGSIDKYYLEGQEGKYELADKINKQLSELHNNHSQNKKYNRNKIIDFFKEYPVVHKHLKEHFNKDVVLYESNFIFMKAVLEEKKIKDTLPMIIWIERYILNKQLIDLDQIPSYIQQLIIKEYSKQTEIKSNPIKVQEFLLEHNLKALYTESSMFFTSHRSQTLEKSPSDIDSFFDDF